MTIPYTLDYFFKHPGMYVSEINFDTAAAFIQGYDAACNHGVLIGFREWLVVKLGYGDNFGWRALFIRFALPGLEDYSSKALLKVDHKRLTALLFKTFEAFWIERESATGLRGIFIRHAEWLKSQDWFREENARD